MADRYVDLSHALEDATPVYPGDPNVRTEPAARMADDGYRVTELALGSHAGTHVDAPRHLLADGRSLGDYPVERFAFEARRIDLTGLDPRQPIEAEDLPASDETETTDLLVCHTGWDAHWCTDRYRDHPYLSPAAARHCVEADWNVAIDAPSPDPSPSPSADEDEPEGFPAHQELLGANLVLVENLTNLDGVGVDRFRLLAFPLPLANADGAPVRAVAVTERAENPR